MIIDEFNNRFEDFRKKEKMFSIFTRIFSFQIEQAPVSLQMELVDLQNDLILKGKYREVGIPNIYSYLGQKYPEVKKFAAEIMCYFGSNYL